MNEETELSVVNQETEGMLAAESNRLVAEIQGQMVIAKKFPRKHEIYMPKILEACQRKGLAKASQYAYPVGKTVVSGPSIRLAEVLAQNYGNLISDVRVLSETKGESLVQSYCYDLETNVKSQKTFKVKHAIKLKNGQMKFLTDPKAIYEHTANYGSRRLRACILAIIPGDVVEKAIKQCDKTMSGEGKTPIKDKIAEMIQAFTGVGVTSEMIEKRLCHKIEATAWAELSELSKIYNSLKDGMAKRHDFFELPKGESDSEQNIEDLKKTLKDDKTEVPIKGKDSSKLLDSEASQASQPENKTSVKEQIESSKKAQASKK